MLHGAHRILVVITSSEHESEKTEAGRARQEFYAHSKASFISGIGALFITIPEDFYVGHFFSLQDSSQDYIADLIQRQLQRKNT